MKRQIHRPNHPSSDVSEYYRRAVTIPLVDHVITELNQRFDSSLNVYHGLVIIPARLLDLISKEEKSGQVVSSWKDQFDTFVSFYFHDFPNPLAINGELEIWARFWKRFAADNCDSVPDSVSSTLKAMPHADGVFDNMEVALRILATVPVTSCECERSFSAMRRLKNYNRSTMTDERLNGLALLHVHLGIQIDKQDIVNRFALKGPRRLDFL